jgi:acyl carrier protein
MVIYAPGGELRFIYRSDPYVMIRGSRVPLGRIEAAVCQHPAVSHAVVVARSTTADQGNLAVYIVRRLDQVANEGESELSIQDLNDFLSMQLPGYMMPSTVMTLDALPQSPGRKINRRGLPEPAPTAPASRTFKAPSSNTELVVAGIWGRVLQLDRVSVNEDFFDLGGDSLKAQRMLAHVEHDLKVSIPTRIAFANPTVAQLSLHIDRSKRIGMTEEEELSSIIDELSDEEVHALLGDAMRRIQPNP